MFSLTTINSIQAIYIIIRIKKKIALTNKLNSCCRRNTHIKNAFETRSFMQKLLVFTVNQNSDSHNIKTKQIQNQLLDKKKKAKNQ